MKSKHSTAKPDPQLAAWCAALSSHQEPEKVPEGWNTSRELCALLGKSQTRINELLFEAVRSGKCQRKNFRIKSACTVRPVPHYKLVGK